MYDTAYLRGLERIHRAGVALLFALSEFILTCFYLSFSSFLFLSFGLASIRELGVVGRASSLLSMGCNFIEFPSC